MPNRSSKHRSQEEIDRLLAFPVKILKGPNGEDIIGDPDDLDWREEVLNQNIRDQASDGRGRRSVVRDPAQRRVRKVRGQ